MKEGHFAKNVSSRKKIGNIGNFVLQNVPLFKLRSNCNAILTTGLKKVLIEKLNIIHTTLVSLIQMNDLFSL